MQVRYYDSQTGRVERIQLPAGVDHVDVELDTPSHRVSVGVSPDSVMLYGAPRGERSLKTLGELDTGDLIAYHTAEQMLEAATL